MQELKPTEFYGLVVWLGLVAAPQEVLAAEPRDSLSLCLDGVEGEMHLGGTRSSCTRVTLLHPKGTTIRNTRQITILSAENLAGIAGGLGLDALDPALLGANIVVEGIPDFTHVPPSSRLQAESGATIVIDRVNLPCLYPAKAVEKAHPGLGKRFKPAAAGRRGVTGWVERAGPIALGDRLRLHVPHQPVWSHLAEALAG